MLARRVGGFRPFARAGTVASIALIGMLLSANAAFAATVIGSAVGNTTCSAGFDTVQISSSSVSYAVPAGGGSISSWTTQAGPVNGQVGLQVWRPTAALLVYQLVGASPLETPPASASMTFTLATPIKVQAGDLIGLRVEGRAYCYQFTAGGTDTYGGHLGATPAVLGTAPFLSNAGTLDVEATVDATVVTPPPPTGCDSTDKSARDSTDKSARESTDNSTGDSTDKSPKDSSDQSTKDSSDQSTKDSSDQSTKDSSDQSKKDKSSKDQSTGGDNCEK